MKGIRQALGFAVVIAVILAFAFPARLHAANLPPSYWAVKDIQEAKESRIVPRWIEGNYRDAITRAQFSEMIVLLYEALTGRELPDPVNNPFRDTRNYYVGQAYELGVVKGTSQKTFSPSAPISREQLAVMVYNTLIKAGFRDRLQTSGIPTFADQKKIAAWSEDAVGILAASSLLQGSQYKDNVWFMPKQTTSIEQAVVLVNRINKQYGTFFVKNEYDLLEAVEKGTSFIIHDEQTRQIYTKAKAVLADIIKPGMSDYEKELAIHDYLVLHVAYDYDNYSKGTVPDASYSAYGTLMDGIAVCQGYANTAKLLLNMAGIEAHIVTGKVKGELHTWNKVLIGGEYYNLDVTWDDPVPDVPGRVDYGYFNVTDEQLRIDHSWQDTLPKATATKYNYYVFNSLTVGSLDEFEARIANAIEMRAQSLTVKRMYADEDGIKGLSAIVFQFPQVDRYSYSLGSDGVITITFVYL
ncbi:S-layer homology domain-containing protein [Paenibacillus mendelii]|uniref:S-layer homology domain-containing protein n=1 Tax=Paenibacillus mendelii TaxID=206163 RepID=A0ABV6JD19_9BACL|nr:S-layer homology domain-containing protein [Paenibacillus mendelii]MCQ6562448.1 S-layer homology domain-containing protein [Paenibacillus mendelii]